MNEQPKESLQQKYHLPAAAATGAGAAPPPPREKSKVSMCPFLRRPANKAGQYGATLLLLALNKALMLSEVISAPPS